MLKPKGRGHAFWPWSFLFLGLVFAGLGAFFGFKWVTTDAPDVYGQCSRGGGSCLQGGETLNMIMTLVWSPLGIIGTAAGFAMVVRHRRRAAADRALIATGHVSDALITDVRHRGSETRTNGRVTSRGYLLTLDPGDGGAPLVMKVELPPGVTAGTRARVAYDPATRDAVLVEDEAAPVGAVLARA